jgi:hypothetical protein
LQGGDFVFMADDELLEGLDEAFGAVEGGLAKAGFDDLVLADVVDGEFVFGFDVEDELAEGGVAEGFRRDYSRLLRGPLSPALSREGRGSYGVGVEGCD